MKKYLIALCFISQISCSPCLKKMASINTNSAENIGQPISNINLELSASEAELNYLLNHWVDDYLKNNPETSIQGYNLKIEKHQSIAVQLIGKNLTLKTPLALEISKKTILGNIKAKGVIGLNFGSEVEISEEWQVTTKTALLNYEWLEPLKLVSGFGISLETIANQLIDSSKGQLLDAIDEQVRLNGNLKPFISNWQNTIEKPLSIPRIENQSYHNQSQYVMIGPMENNNGHLVSQISIQNRMKIDNENFDQDIQLAKLFWAEKIENQNANIRLPIEFHIDSLNTLANQELKGQVLAQGKRKLVIESIDINVKKHSLIAELETSGDFNGNVLITGNPVYSVKQNKLLLENLCIDFESKQVLKRWLLNMFKPRIKSEIQNSLNVEFSKISNDIRKFIDSQSSFFEEKYGIDLMAQMEDIHLENFILEQKMIKGLIRTDGIIKLKLKDLSKLMPQG